MKTKIFLIVVAAFSVSLPSYATKHNQCVTKTVCVNVCEIIKGCSKTEEQPIGTISNKQKQHIDQLTSSDQERELLYALSTESQAKLGLNSVVQAKPNGPTVSSILTPIAYGMDWRHIALGSSYVDHWPRKNARHHGHDDNRGKRDNGDGSPDGSLTASIGLGNAVDYVGLTASVFIGSIDVRDDGFADSGAFAFHLYHIFPHDLAVAVGVANTLSWGGYKHTNDSYYGVVTKIINFAPRGYQMPIVASVGLGNGAFNSPIAYDRSDKKDHEKKVNREFDRDGDDNDNNFKPFASIGWNFFPQVSLIGEYVADRVNLGVGVQPIKKWPVMINLSQNNVNKHDNVDSYFMAGVSIEFSY